MNCLLELAFSSIAIILLGATNGQDIIFEDASPQTNLRDAINPQSGGGLLSSSVGQLVSLLNNLSRNNQTAGNIPSPVKVDPANSENNRPSLHPGSSTKTLASFQNDCGRTALFRNPPNIHGTTRTRAQTNAWPWMVALVSIVKNNKIPLYCGGTLISDRHVITAASCVINGYSHMKALIGSNSIIEYGREADEVPLESVFFEGHFNLANDIAIVQLARPVQLSDYIKPICLPAANNDYSGQTGIMLGWGNSYPGGPINFDLTEFPMTLWDRTECQTSMPHRFQSGMMCAGSKTGGRTFCQGDGGGPLVINDVGSTRYTLIGVVSFGSSRCISNLENPSVFTDVPAFMKWIEQHAIFA